MNNSHHTFPLQTPSPPLWCAAGCWGASGHLRARPHACPGVEPTTALLTGSTSTSRAAALTCWPHPLTAPGQSTSLRSVTGEETAARWETFYKALRPETCSERDIAGCQWQTPQACGLLGKQQWKCPLLTGFLTHLWSSALRLWGWCLVSIWFQFNTRT